MEGQSIKSADSCGKTVTVAIVIYNNYNNLEDAIRVVAEQDYADIELIVSDDCSRGLSKEKMEHCVCQYRHRFKRVVINRNEKNLGTVRHINKIISLAHGEIFCTLAANDLFYSADVISRVASYFYSNPSKMIVTTKRIDEEDNRCRPDNGVIRMINKNPVAFTRKLMRVGSIIGGAGTYFQTQVFREYQMFSERFVLLEDSPYFLQAAMDGILIGAVDSITYIHRGNGVSAVANRNSNMLFKRDRQEYTRFMYEKGKGADWFTSRCVRFRYGCFFLKNFLMYLLNVIKYLDAFVYIGLYWVRFFYSDKVSEKYKGSILTDIKGKKSKNKI